MKTHHNQSDVTDSSSPLAPRDPARTMDRLTTFWSLRNNILENVRKSLQCNYPSIESQCEEIGQILCARIEKSDITLEKVIEDILQYVHCKSKQDRNSKSKQEVNRHFSWLVLHMGLGLCCKGAHRVAKEVPRKVLHELLYYSRGVDFGIFLRDVFDFCEREENLPDKTKYLLSVCAGFTIRFTDYIFICPHGEVWRELLRGDSCAYLDLPIAQPTLPPDVDVNRTHLRASPLLLAIVNMKPKAVLLLLRYGATADGHPLEYILRMFGSLHVFSNTNTAHAGLMAGSIQVLSECFVYCLRTIERLTLLFEPETAVSTYRRNVYHVREEVRPFVPLSVYTQPCCLQHLCRCSIREVLLNSDQIPHGIKQLNIPVHLQEYLDLHR